MRFNLLFHCALSTKHTDMYSDENKQRELCGGVAPTESFVSSLPLSHCHLTHDVTTCLYHPESTHPCCNNADKKETRLWGLPKGNSFALWCWNIHRVVESTRSYLPRYNKITWKVLQSDRLMALTITLTRIILYCFYESLNTQQQLALWWLWGAEKCKWPLFLNI